MAEKPNSHGDTSWFVHDRFGMFIHWGTYAMAARHEWVKNYEQTPDGEYRKYFDRFYPDLYDPRAWARAAREAGMKYFVVTAKHHEGFCLWDTRHTDYKATRTPWGKDLLAPMVQAFRDEGLRVGLYYSLLDWHHPDYTTDRCHPRRNDPDRRAADARRNMPAYAQYMRDQVRELLTQYGKIDVIWYDFSFPGEDGKGRADWESEKLLALTRELQPSILVNNRLDLPAGGDFVTPEQVQLVRPPLGPDGAPAVWEACQTFSGSWGYHRDEQTWKSVPQLLWMLIDGVSKNGNLLLNVGPTARGEFDHRARERLAGMGLWMARHGRSIYGCGAAPPEFECPPDCRLTWNPAAKRLYVHLLNWPLRDLWLTGEAYRQRLRYAQLLNDASEITFQIPEETPGPAEGSPASPAVQLTLPVTKPPVDIPVIELFLA